MLKLEQKQVVDLLEWAGLEVPRTPMKQLSRREKDKATSVFVPKVRKQRSSVLDRDPNQANSARKPRDSGTRENSRSAGLTDAGSQGADKKPYPKPGKRRIRQSSDVPQDLKKPDKQKVGMPHKSDRNRGRG